MDYLLLERINNESLEDGAFRHITMSEPEGEWEAYRAVISDEAVEELEMLFSVQDRYVGMTNGSSVFWFRLPNSAAPVIAALERWIERATLKTVE